MAESTLLTQESSIQEVVVAPELSGGDSDPYWRAFSEVYPVLENAPPYWELVRDLLALMDPKPGEFWLDAGCGSGTMTGEIWRKTGGKARVFAVDHSEVMLEHFRKRAFDPQPRGGEIHSQVADLRERLPFPDCCFDGVVGNLVFSYIDALRDGRKGLDALVGCLEEVRRVLKPGGRLAWSTPKEDPSFVKIFLLSWRAWIRPRIFRDAIKLLRFAQELKRRSLAGQYHYLNQLEIERVMADAGFEQARVLRTYAGEGWIALGYKR